MLILLRLPLLLTFFCLLGKKHLESVQSHGKIISKCLKILFFFLTKKVTFVGFYDLFEIWYLKIFNIYKCQVHH